MKALGSIAGAKRCGPGPFGPLEITCLYFMNLLDKQEARKITTLGISKVTGSLVINNVHDINKLSNAICIWVWDVHL
jgi:hypothetical protein